LKGGVRKVFLVNKKGSILVSVLVVVVVLTILGVTLGSAALNDQRQAKRQQKNNEAFYLARSGAEAVAALLIKNPEDALNYVGQTTESTLGSGRFVVSVENGGSDKILIHSTGYSGDYSEKVTLTLVGGGTSGYKLPEFDLALFCNNGIDFGTSGSSQIVGDAGTNSIAKDAVVFPWSASVGNLYIGPGGDPSKVVKATNPSGNYQKIENLADVRVYPLPIFPDFPNDLPPRGTLSTESVLGFISEDGYYDKIQIKRPLTINVGNGIRKIRVKNLVYGSSGGIPLTDWSSTIIIEGTGVLELYVEDGFNINSASLNYGGDPGQVMIYYNGDNNASITGSAAVCACFFSYSSTASFTVANGGDGSYSGFKGVAFINGKSVTISGNNEADVSVIYAPNAKVSVLGSGRIKGAVVAESYSSPGANTRLIYSPESRKMLEDIPLLKFEPGFLEPIDGASGYVLGGWSD
jgi:type II secretory pathway pseudopilin PulG